LYESPSADPTLGYASGEFLGQSLFQLIHPDDLDRVQSRFAQFIQDASLHPREQFRLRHRDGTWRWIEAVGTNLLAEPSVRGIVVNYHDITERKIAEETQARLTAIIEATSDFVAFADLDGRPLYLNKGGRQMLGIGEDEDIPNIKIADVHPEWARALVLNEGIPTALRDGIWRDETALLTRDGREIPVLQVIVAPKRPDGTADFHATIMRDITERKRAEDALRESEEKFKTLFNSANDAIFTLNHTTFLDCNATTEKIFRCSRDQIIGHSPVDFSPEQQPDGSFSGKSAVEKIEAAFAGEPQLFEWLHTHLDGTPFYAEVSLNRVSIGGEFILQAIVRDITERRQAEETLRKKEEHHKAVIENIFQFVPEGVLVLTESLNLLKQNKVFDDILQKYAPRLGYAEQELADEIIQQLRSKILSGNTREIHIPKKSE